MATTTVPAAASQHAPGASSATTDTASNSIDLVTQLIRRKRMPERIIEIFAHPENYRRFRFSWVQSGWADVYTMETNEEFDALPEQHQWQRFSAASVWPQVGQPKTGELFLAARKSWNGYVDLIQYHGPAYDETFPHAWTHAVSGCALWIDDYELLLQVSIPDRDEPIFRDGRGKRFDPAWFLPTVVEGQSPDLCNFRPAHKSNMGGKWFAADVKSTCKNDFFTERKTMVFDYSLAEQPKDGDVVFAFIDRKSRPETKLQRSLQALAAKSVAAERLLACIPYEVDQLTTREFVLRRFVQGEGLGDFSLLPLEGDGEVITRSSLVEINIYGVAIPDPIWGKDYHCVMV